MADTSHEDSSQHESRLSSSAGDSSSNSSDSSSSSSEDQMEETQLCALQDYILDLPEEEWNAFGSLLHTPMTRVQFADLCMAILKVVSLSSITVILPAYVCLAKESESSSSGSSSPSSESSSGSYSSSLTSVKDELRSALGSLGGEDRPYDAISHDSLASQLSTAHDITCLTLIIEDLLSNGNISTIARNLVQQVQKVLQDRSQAKQRPDAKNVIYIYAEDAIKNLLQPYFLPLLAWSIGRESTPSRLQATRGSPTPSLLALKSQCSCLLTTLMQQLPGIIQSQQVEVYPPCKRTDVANLFARLMTHQVMDIVDSELQKHGRRLGTPYLPQSEAEQGGFFTGLIKRFLAEFRFSDSESGEDTRPTTATTRSPSARSATPSIQPEMAGDFAASRKLGDVLNIFTRVMVNQVMDIIRVEEIRERAALVQGESPSSVSLPFFPSSENGCLTTVLLLRHLANIRDQETAPMDLKVAAAHLIGQILSEFNDGSGNPTFQGYSSNLSIQTVYRGLDQFLLEAYGPSDVLQRATDTRDTQFDLLLLATLREQLTRQATPLPTETPGIYNTVAPLGSSFDSATLYQSLNPSSAAAKTCSTPAARSTNATPLALDNSSVIRCSPSPETAPVKSFSLKAILKRPSFKLPTLFGDKKVPPSAQSKGK